MTKFEELQTAHEHLMEQSNAPEDAVAFVAKVQHEIHNMCVAAEDIPAPRERDQLRAILRFWASYVYDHTGTYPETTLRPARTASIPPEPPPPDSDQTRPPLFRIALAAGVVLSVLLVVVALVPTVFGPAPTPAKPPNATAEVTTGRPSPAQPEIQWNVLTSGPSPFDDNVWAVKLQLSATGGNGNYIFWANGTRLPDITNNQFIVEGKDCTPEKPVVGVTSGGQATSLELTIMSPLTECQ